MSADKTDIQQPLYISVKEYVDTRFLDAKDAREAADKALTNQLDAMKYETRNQFPTREELTHIIAEIKDDIRGIQLSDAVLAGKASQNAVIAALAIGIIDLLLSIAYIVVIIVK